MRHGRLWLPILTFAIFQHRSTAQDNCDGVCGRRPLAPSHGGLTRIIGGTNALPGTWPWMVSFCKVVGNQLFHFCGGSLISACWVISAAHCFRPESDIEDLRAFIGLTNFAALGPEVQEIRLKRVINHKFYHQGNNNDITLVELDEPALCNDYVQPACLPDRSVDVPSLPHCYISGWGITNVTTKKGSQILKEAKVNLIPTEICNSSGWVHGLIKPDCLCAGFEEGGVDTCQGDSGGPLMCREARSERFWVVGITSFGSGCAKAKKPGVYSATQKFIDWITTQSGQNFYRPVHLPVALTAPKPKPATAVSRPRPQPQPQPWPQSPAQLQQSQPQPAVWPRPQARPRPTVRPQPQPPSPVRPPPQPPVRPWHPSRPQPTVRPQRPVWPQPRPPVRPWPQSRPQPTVRPQPQPCDRGPCGRRPGAPSHGGPARTEGGASVLPGAWPWLVSIQLPEGDGFRHWCAGSLISSRWVLSAAHCFVLKRYVNVEYWRVLVGVTQLSQPGPSAQVLPIKRLVEHENYNRIGFLNDIALIELTQPVACNDYIHPACLPDDSLPIPELTHCYFSGWGTVQAKENLQKPEILQEVRVNLLDTEACNSSLWYYKRIQYNNLCAMAEKGGKERCQGDGGAPLMCREEQSERFWVVGINSWGSSCTEARMPAVFISTQRFFSWIRRITREVPQPGGQPRPKPSMQQQQQPPNWSPPWAKPVSVPRPTGWFRPGGRPNFSWDRPNYIPMPPPQSQLPTRWPAASGNSGNPWFSRPQLKPWSRPQLQPQFQQRPPSQALYNWTPGLPRPHPKPQPQPPSLAKPPAGSQQFQNWGGTSFIIRRPRPQPPFQGQNQGQAGGRL